MENVKNNNNNNNNRFIFKMCATRTKLCTRDALF